MPLCGNNVEKLIQLKPIFAMIVFILFYKDAFSMEHSLVFKHVLTIFRCSEELTVNVSYVNTWLIIVGGARHRVCGLDLS